MHPNDVIAGINNAAGKSELHEVVGEYAQHIGMDGAYIINFHPSHGMTFVDKRPEEWMKIYGRGGYIYFDPIAERAFQGKGSFTWDQCINRSKLSREQRNLMWQARDFGLKQGYNTALPGEDMSYSASTCCFYNEHLGNFEQSLRQNKTNMDNVGAAAQLKLRKIVESSIDLPHLSDRQKQCLIQAARGLSNEDIATVIGISKNTVNSHIRDACSELGTRTKIQAVTKAIQLRLIFPFDLSTPD